MTLLRDSPGRWNSPSRKRPSDEDQAHATFFVRRTPSLTGRSTAPARVVALFRLCLLCLSASLVGPALAKGPTPAPSAPVAAPPQKVVTDGVFQDASGQSHSWQVTPTHVLEWDGRPYLPVGGSFTPHSWVEGQTDDNWNADVLALQSLKQHGVTDLTLNAGALGLTHVPTGAVQRLLDYLDAHGFEYGLDVADFPKQPLIGYTIEPSVYRNASPPEQGTVRFTRIAGLVDAFSVLASSSGSGVPDRLESGPAAIGPGGTASVKVTLGGGDGDVLLLYPRRSFGPGTPEGHLPDLWQGYDEYRDRLLAFLNGLRLGGGFRFFLDPLTDRIGLNGEVQNLVPTTDGFHRDFQAWLDQRYGHNLDTLNHSWGLTNHDLADFATAARCVPLWYGVKGLPELYDPTKGTFLDIFNSPRIQSNYWYDLETFKILSTRGYMDSIADALKHGVADVPVVYTWTQHSPLFTDAETDGGYDGLGIEAYGHGLDLTKSVAAYVYAQAQETPKTTWLIVSATADAPPAQKLSPGFAGQTVLDDDWDSLKDLGARGFFVNSLQALPAAANADVSLVGLPDQLGWLGSYAAGLRADADTLEAERPAVLWYPESVAGPAVGVRPLAGDVWWLPTYAPGQALTLGPSLRGYELNDPDDGLPLTAFWSPGGTLKSAPFTLGPKAAPVVTDVSGTPIPVRPSHGIWTIPVSAVPTLVRGIPYLPLSIDAADDADAEAHRLLNLAVKQNVDIQSEDNYLFLAENETHKLAADDPIRYSDFQQIVSRLTLLLQPFTWVEAESSADTTFSSVAPDTDASNGAYLSLDTDSDPPSDDAAGGYHASYTFSVNGPGDYALWAAATPPGSGASPFTWSVDDGPASDAEDDQTSGGPYAGKFAWRDLGDVPLRGGRHTLTIAVTGRRLEDQRYVLGLDAFCVTRVPFSPDGPTQPSVDSWLPPATPDDKDKKHKK